MNTILNRLATTLQMLYDDYKSFTSSGDAGKWKVQESELGKTVEATLNAYSLFHTNHADSIVHTQVNMSFKTRAKHESMRAIGWKSPEEITAILEENLQASGEALHEANETTRLWKKRYQDLVQLMSTVKVPTNEEEATAMALLGVNWLQANAPNKLTQFHRDIQSEAGRAGFVAGYSQHGHDIDDGYSYRDESMANQYAARVKAGE